MKKFVDKVCRLEFTTFKYFDDHENDSPSHRLLSLAQFVPAHSSALSDEIIAPYTCPLHEDDDPLNFVLENQCVEHIKTHASSDNVKPINRLEGRDRSSLGVYTCKYDNFKTNFIKFANFHFRAVHLKHLDIPKNFKGQYIWKENFQMYFDTNCANSIIEKGNFKCKLDGDTFLNKQTAVRHLVSDVHRNQFKRAANGEKVPGIKQSLALKVVELFNTYEENDIAHKLFKNSVDTKFLSDELVIIEKATKSLLRYFWQFPDQNDNTKYINDITCYSSTRTAWKNIYHTVKVDLFKNKEYSDHVRNEYDNWVKNPKLKNEQVKKYREKEGYENLHAGSCLISPEIQQIVGFKKFKEYINVVKKFKLLDSRKIQNKNLVPEGCQ